MKCKAYTVRLNLDVETERLLYDKLEGEAKSHKSASEYIKSVLVEHFNKSGKDSLESIISKSQKEMLEQIYDVCLKIISSVSGLTVNPTLVTKKEESTLPETTDSFPDTLADVLDLMQN